MDKYFLITDKLNRLHEQMSNEYLAGAFVWADETRNGVHSKMMNDLDNALLEYNTTGDHDKLQSAIDFYFSSSLKLVHEYKAACPPSLKRDMIDMIKSKLE